MRPTSVARSLVLALAGALALGSPIAIATLAAAADAPVPAAPPVPSAPTWAEVAAILDRSCVHCHGGDRPVQGLAVDSHANVLKGAAGRPVVVAGAPEKSVLLGRLRGEIQPQMPYYGDPLPAAEIALIEAWIRAGAPDAPALVPPPAGPPGGPSVPQAPAAGPGVPAVPVAPAAAPPVPVDPAAPLRWADVRSILRASCVRCHQTKGLKGPAPEGLRFTDYASTIGGARVAVVPGRPDASPLVRAVDGRARKRMPLDGPPWLRPAEIATLTRWVREGARGDDGTPAPMPVGGEVRLFGVYDGGSSVDGVAFVVDGSTRRDDGVTKGRTVEVRAIVAADGALRATRLRGRSATDGADDDRSRGGDDHGGGRRDGDDDGPGDDHGGGRRGGDDDGPGDDHGGGRRGRDDK